MCSIKFTNPEQLGWYLRHQKCLWVLLLIILLVAGCAAVSVNNYQNAETLGKGNFKMGGAFEYGKRVDVGIDTYEGEIEIQNHLDWDNFTFPMVVLSGQFGITKSTDIELTLTSSPFIIPGSMIIHLKQNLAHTPGNLAISVMPGGGIFGVHSESSGGIIFHPELRFEEEEEFLGYHLDLPIIISKRWNFFSLHLSPRYMYQCLKVRTDYKEFRKSDDTMMKHNSDEETFQFHPFGATVGFSLVFKHLQLTPEVSYLRVKDLPKDAYRWILYPGLGLYVKF